MQGLDALGLATLETAAARVPFSAFFFSSLMSEEDRVNLRTFQRLMLLLSGTRRKEDSNTVRFVVYLNRTTSMHCICYDFVSSGILLSSTWNLDLKFNLWSKNDKMDEIQKITALPLTNWLTLIKFLVMEGTRRRFWRVRIVCGWGGEEKEENVWVNLGHFLSIFDILEREGWEKYRILFDDLKEQALILLYRLILINNNQETLEIKYPNNYRHYRDMYRKGKWNGVRKWNVVSQNGAIYIFTTELFRREAHPDGDFWENVEKNQKLFFLWFDWIVQSLDLYFEVIGF